MKICEDETSKIIILYVKGGCTYHRRRRLLLNARDISRTMRSRAATILSTQQWLVRVRVEVVASSRLDGLEKRLRI